MAKLYRSSARRGLGGTVRVTVELPSAVVDVLLKLAQTDYVEPKGPHGLADFLAWRLCFDAQTSVANVDTHDEDLISLGGDVLLINNRDEELIVPLLARHLDKLPTLHDYNVRWRSGGLRRWWLKPCAISLVKSRQRVADILLEEHNKEWMSSYYEKWKK